MHPLLLRTFLQRSLAAYFARASSPVGAVPAPLPFHTFLDHHEYRAATRALYDTLSTAWLTPSELLQPHYGRAIAQWICADWAASGRSRLHVVEVGGGSGRLANDVLHGVLDEQKTLGVQGVATVLYTSIEPSAVLAARQQACNSVYNNVYNVVQRDALQEDAFNGIVDDDNTHVVLLMSEVLDNLPHDRVVHDEDGRWAATVVMDTGSPIEALSHEATVQDPLIRMALEVFTSTSPDDEKHTVMEPPGSFLDHVRRWIHETIAPQSTILWLPTGALQLFLNAQRHLPPNHSILAFDFDYLPDVCIAGQGAPIVSDTRNGHTYDYATYMVPKGAADIFFPTDFGRLCALVNMVGQGSVAQYSKASHFFAALPASQQCATRSGYNPLLGDFTNTSVLMRGVMG